MIIMKNSLLLILISTAIIRCSDWTEKPTIKSSHAHTVWHYALKDSFTIQFEIDSMFHLTGLKSIWDDSNASYGYEYKNSSIVISYYALSRYIDTPALYEKLVRKQRSKLGDAYPQREILESAHMNLGDLDGVYTSSYDNEVKQIIYEGLNQKSQVEIHVLITIYDNTHDPQMLLKDLVSSMTFLKKKG